MEKVLGEMKATEGDAVTLERKGVEGKGGCDGGKEGEQNDGREGGWEGGREEPTSVLLV